MIDPSDKALIKTYVKELNYLSGGEYGPDWETFLYDPRKDNLVIFYNPESYSVNNLRNYDGRLFEYVGIQQWTEIFFVTAQLRNIHETETAILLRFVKERIRFLGIENVEINNYYKFKKAKKIKQRLAKLCPFAKEDQLVLPDGKVVLTGRKKIPCTGDFIMFEFSRKIDVYQFLFYFSEWIEEATDFKSAYKI